MDGMMISNETRKALKYLVNVTLSNVEAEHVWFHSCPKRFRDAVQHAVEGFRADEARMRRSAESGKAREVEG